MNTRMRACLMTNALRLPALRYPESSTPPKMQYSTHQKTPNRIPHHLQEDCLKVDSQDHKTLTSRTHNQPIPYRGGGKISNLLPSTAFILLQSWDPRITTGQET